MTTMSSEAVITKNMEARKEAFEAWAKEKGWPITRRNDACSPDYYFAFETQQRWECWNAALDSICVELPEACSMTTAELDEGYNAGHLKWEILNALTAAGVPYK